MTREEIINEIKCLLSELDNGEDAVSYLTQNDAKWLKENIKALERQNVLFKSGLLKDCETCRALEQQPEDAISRYGVLHKIAEFFINWNGDENAKLEISVRDMREINSMFVTKCRAESKLKALKQHNNVDKLIGKLEDEKFKLCNDDIHCSFDGGLERAKQIVKEFYEVEK